jgi:hypothetical protein
LDENLTSDDLGAKARNLRVRVLRLGASARRHVEFPAVQRASDATIGQAAVGQAAARMGAVIVDRGDLAPDAKQSQILIADANQEAAALWHGVRTDSDGESFAVDCWRSRRRYFGMAITERVARAIFQAGEVPT